MNKVDRKLVEVKRPCYVKSNKAFFHLWITVTFPKGTSFFHQTLAVVEFEDGHIEQVQPKSIVFADGGDFDKYSWLPLNEKGDGVETGEENDT